VSTPTLTTGVEAPFSLTIRGSRLTHNLLALQPKGFSLDGEIVPEYQRPYVLPESVTLEQSADNIGGTLSFTIEEPLTLWGEVGVTPHYGAWFEDGRLPDNAIVEYTQGAAVDPNLRGQTRLFVGFIDQIDIETNGAGQGTRATVTCVSTNTILDRIVVRKPIGATRRGLAAGKVTIKAGSDRAQIKAILKLAGSLRKYGSLLIFNPGNHSLVEDTGVSLPALEVQPGTLRSALESVIEAAQEKDGKRRQVHVDPATGALAYGYAVSDITTTNATAPWMIVDQPSQEVTTAAFTQNFDSTVRRFHPILFYRMNEGSSPALNRPVSAGSRSKAGAIKTTAGTPTWQIAGPLTNGEPGNYAVNLTGDTLTGTAIGADYTGDRTLITYLKRGGEVRIGGADGLLVGIQAGGSNYFYFGLGGTTYTTTDVADADVWYPVSVRRFGTSLQLFIYGLDEQRTETGITDATAKTREVRVTGGPVGPIIFLPGDATSEGPAGVPEVAIIQAGEDEPSPNAITPRDLRITLDHSRIVKSALLLTADSAADKDTDPDPYLRSYDALKNAAGTARAFEQRPGGPRFEAIVEASTIRSPKAATRATAVDRLARAFFTTRRKPEIGIQFTIRGAGTGQFQKGLAYGYSGGWRNADEGGLVYVPGWKPGQFVRIQNDALSIKANFLIVSVTQTFEPGSFVRSFQISCENRPKNSVARLLVAE
jgi:hypothetical protein